MDNITLVLGASLNPIRYSNKAIKALRANEINVVAIGAKEGEVADVFVTTKKEKFNSVDTVTLYLNPSRQKEYYSYILNLSPRRVIFNPGTENSELMNLLKENIIEVEIACTLVLLATKQY
ncbi:CoA-binding protein [Tenacibaculum holothuriorum]|uniref:CoA-binding protein n=1 Tax=Tenacibaculum holothuriorum TaxID=1635173 RepID=A0A1Y2PCM3_9FLAO|nr:CoA-binding protein [Tenacibaculum holothuriorum]OSY88212.1 CoA-binding protein [Tenacibaculum holothuriorum]